MIVFNYTCIYCGKGVKTNEEFQLHLDKRHQNISSRDKKEILKDFEICLKKAKLKQEKKRVKPPVSKTKKKKTKSKSKLIKNYFDKSLKSIRTIFTPMGNKR